MQESFLREAIVVEKKQRWGTFCLPGAFCGEKEESPQAMVLLNEGFHASQAREMSNPPSSGEITSSTVTQYALCAASHVLGGQRPTVIFNPHSSSHREYSGGEKVTCPAGQIATRGEYQGQDTVLASQATGADFASWSVVAGGNADMTISAICVLILGKCARSHPEDMANIGPRFPNSTQTWREAKP